MIGFRLIALIIIVLISSDTLYSQDSIVHNGKMYKIFKDNRSKKDSTYFIKLENSDTVNIVKEKMPEFPNGIEGLMSYIQKNTKYPISAKNDNIHGRVLAQFVILENGKTDSVKIIQSVRADVDNEVIRIINSMPKWSPGTQNGKPVKVHYSLPVRF